MDFDLSEARYKPFEHQVEGIRRLVVSPYLLLADEMGLGKTKQVIDAAQVLLRLGIINKVLVICPSPVKSVWYDPQFGEIRKHAWKSIVSQVAIYGVFQEHWLSQDEAEPELLWTITNYEYLRKPDRLKLIKSWVDRKTWLVLDESSAVKNWKSKQTRAVRELRPKVDRCVLLNGTPIANSPTDLFAQANLLHPSILDCEFLSHFHSQYAVLRGDYRKPVDWPGLPKLRQLFKPHAIRRLKKNCLDLPPKLPPVTLTAPLSRSTWAKYVSMRDEMIVELSDESESIARQAVVKIIRLAQLTSGFLGGIVTEGAEVVDIRTKKAVETETHDISDEKLKLFLGWYHELIEKDPNVKILVWCRFRREMMNLREALADRYFESVRIGLIHGGQKRNEQEASIRLLSPETTPRGPVIGIGTPQTGRTGLNLTAASVVVYVSHDYSLYTRLQSEDRVHRPGQIRPVSYFDIIATGPAGQKTIDHTVMKALRDKQEIADWTVNHWLKALKDEVKGTGLHA